MKLNFNDNEKSNRYPAGLRKDEKITMRPLPSNNSNTGNGNTAKFLIVNISKDIKYRSNMKILTYADGNGIGHEFEY